MWGTGVATTRLSRTGHAHNKTHCIQRGRNSSVGSAWARCPQRRGFDPPLGTFSVELELTWVQLHPPKTPSDESIEVCAYMHFIARTRKKILTFMSTGECRQQKHTQQAPSTKTECDYLNGWIKKRSHTQKSHPKVVNPRDIAGERKKKKKKKNCIQQLNKLSSNIVIKKDRTEVVHLVLHEIVHHVATS